MEFMVDAGMSPLDVVRTATINAAELLRAGDRIGRPAAGMLAGLIAVDGDPTQDIGALRDLRLVIKNGALVRRESSIRPASLEPTVAQATTV
jgi:imidazolonepropionase-like amidohydrolase